MSTPTEKPAIRILWNDEHPLTHDDLVALLREFGDLLPDPLSQRLDIDAYASKLLKHAEIACAFVSGEIAGLIAIYANDQETATAHMPLMAVLPAYRRLGVATALMTRAVARARERAMRRCWFTVEQDNRPARRLFAELGFRAFAAKPPKLYMELSLMEQFEMLKPRETPLEPASRLATALGLHIDLRMKRDDLYPLSGGGIKARKIGYIVKDAMERGYDALVTNGGPQSNHARATAIVAAKLGLKCHLVLVLDPTTAYSMSGNILLMRLSGASIELCSKDQLAVRMDRAIDSLTDMGHRPLYIWGGGHCLQGTVAFVEAAVEARNQCDAWVPDYVVVASGTGTTQAGLAIGYADLPTQVVGISVAREGERGARVVQQCIDEFLAANSRHTPPTRVIFRDEWTDGGYEQYSTDLFSLIERAATTGYFFDPTYSGKALRGLVSMVNQGEIPSGSKVLLWHTGGLMNLQAVLRYTEGSLRL